MAENSLICLEGVVTQWSKVEKLKVSSTQENLKDDKYGMRNYGHLAVSSFFAVS